MIVTMRSGIAPKCNVHPELGMTLRQLGEPTGLTMKAYVCNAKDCIEAYNSSIGYFDLVNDRVLRRKEQQFCRKCETPLYLDTLNSDGTETWRCAQNGCDYETLFTQDPH
jgi:hypothetical protein